MFLLVDYGKVLCLTANRQAPAKLRCFFKRTIYSRNIDCFAVDSSSLQRFTDPRGLLSVTRKQYMTIDLCHAAAILSQEI